jgi:hypothetical protein
MSPIANDSANASTTQQQQNTKRLIRFGIKNRQAEKQPRTRTDKDEFKAGYATVRV